MKKIPLSNFKKYCTPESFEDVKKAVRKSSYDSYALKNTTVNISLIVNNLDGSEIKSKFVNWSSGYDFAVVDFN
jgi:hypothetical protein